MYCRGHTLFIGTNGTQTINQSLYRQLPYDPVADFAAIGMMWSAPHLVAVNPAVAAQSLDAFIAYARAHPGEQPAQVGVPQLQPWLGQP